MNTEFTLFRVKQGKEARANEWMQKPKQRREECIATLKREAMLYESVFKVMQTSNSETRPFFLS